MLSWPAQHRWGRHSGPGPAPHLRGEVRLPEDPTSTLYITDGQVFYDTGIPVVLLMENIDLDYGAALLAIAIETVARTATGKEDGWLSLRFAR